MIQLAHSIVDDRDVKEGANEFTKSFELGATHAVRGIYYQRGRRLTERVLRNIA